MLAPIHMIHKGGSSMRAYNNMVQGLTPSNAQKWLQSNVKYMSLKTGSMAFVPYGYAMWTISHSSQENYSIRMPIFSPSLYGSLRPEIATNIRVACKEFLNTVRDDRLWQEISPALKKFIDNDAP